MNRTLAKFILPLLILGYLWLHYFTLSKVFKKREELTEISGLVTLQKMTKVIGKGNNKAIILGTNNYPIQIAIHDKYERAFTYLRLNRVIGKQIKVLYDPSGYNHNGGLTYHIFELQVEGQTLLGMDEAVSLERYVTFILLLVDGLIIFFIFRYRYLMKLKDA